MTVCNPSLHPKSLPEARKHKPYTTRNQNPSLLNFAERNPYTCIQRPSAAQRPGAYTPTLTPKSEIENSKLREQVRAVGGKGGAELKQLSDWVPVALLGIHWQTPLSDDTPLLKVSSDSVRVQREACGAKLLVYFVLLLLFLFCSRYRS